MKKLFKIITSIVVLSLLLTACQKSEETAENALQAANKIQGSEDINRESRNSNAEQGPPDLYGKVKSIVGNEVLLELAEMPEMQDAQQGNTERSINEVAVGGGMGPMPGGQRPGGNREVKYTGETTTLLIPVGVPITSFGQNASKQLDIGDIYEGTLLQIWFDKNDKERIIQVRIIQGR